MYFHFRKFHLKNTINFISFGYAYQTTSSNRGLGVYLLVIKMPPFLPIRNMVPDQEQTTIASKTDLNLDLIKSLEKGAVLCLATI